LGLGWIGWAVTKFKFLVQVQLGNTKIYSPQKNFVDLVSLIQLFWCLVFFAGLD